MKLSARNALKGKVTEVKLGQVVGEVVLDIGGQKVTSVIPVMRSKRWELR